ncbi:hypothetical protein B0H17DRAFT_1216053 [Mycena rosella]|uniref:Uncharacterized protein n=1 Tax=Mycena rosella TaxID=1033263 RepID=A0AAD7FY35_MYCRO|nr:hypothetical protein B0H17DRAFT_1216053 [Mycena rosella]
MLITSAPIPVYTSIPITAQLRVISDSLAGHYARTGILSKEDLTTFYRQFLRIATYLVSKNCLFPPEQSRSFLHAMQPALPKTPTRSPTSTTLPSSYSSLTSVRVVTVTDIIKVLAGQQTGQNNAASNGNAAKKPRPDGCGYCSDLDHFINQCKRVLEDIQAGKCRRNSDGRFVLPSGAFNPRQLAAAQLLVEVAVDHLSAPSASSASTARTYTLSDEDRMEALKREFETLLTHSQAKRALAANKHEEPERTIPPPTAKPAAAPAPPTPAAPSSTPAPLPSHPFAGARDAGAPVPQLFNEAEPALPFSSDILEEQRANDARRTNLLDPLPASYVQAQFNSPAGAFAVPYPYAVYYDSGAIPDDLIVSMESSAICSILHIIDNQQQVECIVVAGSQIIAMSEAVCHEFPLSHDPRIFLCMQSANGSISSSLGLARNIPFRIGDITLYLQVHIVRNPAYDVLLGHPFDVLMQSTVRNFANKDQTITIAIPIPANSLRFPRFRAALPVLARRVFPTRGIDP